MRPRGKDRRRDYEDVPALKPYALTAVALMASLSGCAKRPSLDECEKMLEHGIELSIRDKYPKIRDTLLEKEKARRRRQPPGRAAIEACSKEVSLSAFGCAMSSTTIDTYEQCLVPLPWQ